mgnify:CR=1 FL=1
MGWVTVKGSRQLRWNYSILGDGGMGGVGVWERMIFVMQAVGLAFFFAVVVLVTGWYKMVKVGKRCSVF